MSDYLDTTVRDARPTVVDASPAALARARASAHALTGSTGPHSTHGKTRAMLPVAALLIAGAFFAGFMLGPGSSQSAGEVTIKSASANYGVSLALPAGWTGRVYNEQPPAAAAAAYLQAGNFNLPTQDDDVGTEASRAMTSDDVLVALLESVGEGGGFHYRHIDGAPSLVRADLGQALEGVPTNHAVARIFFTQASRKFVLTVQFGSTTVSDAQLRTVNGVLSTLRIDPSNH